MRALAREVQEMTKVVISDELEGVAWENSRLICDNLVEEVRKLKEGEGTDIAIFGSGSVVQQLANAGLIDEYLIAVTPVVLGEGKPLFKNVGKSSLNLLETRDFPSGNVLLRYQPREQ
jgi:dihydrofolate reductase